MDGFRRRALHNFRRAIDKEQVSIKEIADGYNKHILPSLRNVSPIPMRATEFERVGYVPTSMLDEYMEEIFIEFFYTCSRRCFGGRIFGMDEFRMICTLVKTFNSIMDPDGDGGANVR